MKKMMLLTCIKLSILWNVVNSLSSRIFKEYKSIQRRFKNFQHKDYCNDYDSRRGILIVVPPDDGKLVDFMQSFGVTTKQDVIFGTKQMLTAPHHNSFVILEDTQANVDILHGLSSITNSIYVITDTDPVVRLNSSINTTQYSIYIDASTDGAAASSQKRLLKLIQRIQSPPCSRTDTLRDAGLWSHFVSLTFPSIDEAAPSLPALQVGADALELRVDLLSNQSVVSIHRQIGLLRQLSSLPIVYTVRSVGQIGKFPPDPDRIFALLKEGLRAGVEWLDVEACWPQHHVDEISMLVKSQYASTSRLLGSLHVTVPQTRQEIDNLFVQCDLNGHADMLKVVTGAENDDDCRRVHEAGTALAKPYIGVCLGAKGSMSRVLNTRFTPVTHPLMASAAPGQLSAKQLMDLRQEMNLIAPKQFYLFGHPIQQSMSPAMHNAAYARLLLPHHYSLNEQTEVAAYTSLLNGDESFGGASVTIPHKESIIPLLDEVSSHAVAIGAVNTIVLEPAVAHDQAGHSKKTRTVGYNTDWIGIKRPLERAIAQRARSGSSQAGGAGVVIGAGGTARAACYAVKELGLRLIVSNRNEDKGREIASRFNGTFIRAEDLPSFDAGDVTVVVSTVPATANFSLPDNFFLSHEKALSSLPVVLDVVYKPVRTTLIQQALSKGCIVIQGATMLLEQGLEQFEIWNMRRAPRDVMDAAVFSGIERL